MGSPPDCGAIVLAAGASTRLGQPKQLLRYRGVSLLRRTVDAAREAGCDPIVVVTGYEAARMMAEVADLDVTCVENEEWRSGMASSVRAGVSALSPASCQYALLMVCDQPRIEAGLLTRLMEQAALNDASAAASSYAGVAGVPAVFKRAAWPRLLNLIGDEGARRILASCDDMVEVEFPGGAADIDVPGDLLTLED